MHEYYPIIFRNIVTFLVLEMLCGLEIDRVTEIFTLFQYVRYR